MMLETKFQAERCSLTCHEDPAWTGQVRQVRQRGLVKQVQVKRTSWKQSAEAWQVKQNEAVQEAGQSRVHVAGPVQHYMEQVN